MFIDILFLFILIAAIIKGFSKGLIVATFSFAAFFIGLAAALKLSSSVANWLQTTTTIATYWLPFIAFALIMIGVFFLVKIGATIVEKSVQFAMLGWVNKLGGIILYALLYMSLLSVFLFFFNKMNLIKQETLSASKTCQYLKPIAPKVIDVFGEVLPFLKDIFEDLSKFFERKVTVISNLSN
jgi:membrane protein required for colicin V production